MANLTEFIGIAYHSTKGGGDTVAGTWVGNETDYNTIRTVSAINIDGVPNLAFDADSNDFFTDFEETIFFIYEDE